MKVYYYRLKLIEKSEKVKNRLFDGKSLSKSLQTKVIFKVKKITQMQKSISKKEHFKSC